MFIELMHRTWISDATIWKFLYHNYYDDTMKILLWYIMIWLLTEYNYSKYDIYDDCKSSKVYLDKDAYFYCGITHERLFSEIREYTTVVEGCLHCVCMIIHYL